MAKCQNGGACVNGKCICPKNFAGEFCEDNLTEESNAGWWILIIIFLAALGVGGYLLFKKNQDSWMANKKGGLEGNFIEKNQKPTQIN